MISKNPRRRESGRMELIILDAATKQVSFKKCKMKLLDMKTTPIREALATAPQNTFAKGNLIHTSRSRK